VTGYWDGDGSFYIVLRKDKSCKFGYSIGLECKVVAEINPLNLELLEKVKYFFGGIGTISKDKNTYHFTVRNKSQLRNILDHFYNYPCQTTKNTHFLLWSKIFYIIERKEHSTLQGFMEVLSIKAVFPTGLKDSVKKDFPDVCPIVKPKFIPSAKNLKGDWIAGFTQADGSFGLNIYESPGMRLGYSLQPAVRIVQHERDLIVLERIINY
uniref:LAGLIDADG homing endonuclease n=1 Tax=Elmerina hispida TaxID=1245649 RepID=UPI003002607A